jgi:hypothetical protein
MEKEVEERKRGRPDEDARVRRWRREQFLAMGFAPVEARRLTALAIDLGDMRRLIAAGCPLETARRILL